MSTKNKHSHGLNGQTLPPKNWWKISILQYVLVFMCVNMYVLILFVIYFLMSGATLQIDVPIHNDGSSVSSIAISQPCLKLGHVQTQFPPQKKHRRIYVFEQL